MTARETEITRREAKPDVRRWGGTLPHGIRGL